MNKYKDIEYLFKVFEQIWPSRSFKEHDFSEAIPFWERQIRVANIKSKLKHKNGTRRPFDV